MRKLTVLITLVFLFSCNYGPTNQQKAEALTRQYLLRTLTYPANYHPIGFGRLDSFFATYHETKEHQVLYEKLDTLERIANRYFRVNVAFVKSKTGQLPADWNKYEEEIISLRKRDSIQEATYRVQLSGWTLVHDFLGRTDTTLTKASIKFKFDKNVEYIMDVQYNE